MITKILDKLRRTNALLGRFESTNPAMEIVYRELFLRELDCIGIEDTYYPVGSAANHSLLYFLARAMRELQLRTVLDLGAGQSTILFDRIRKKLNKDCRITTIEHDRYWVDQIAAQVDHPIILAQLKPMTVADNRIAFYDSRIISDLLPVNLLLIDGPPAWEKSTRFARLGALEIVRSKLERDFVIVVDDAERKGEDFLASEIADLLDEKGVVHRRSQIAAIKRQVIFAAGEFSAAAFY